MLEVTINKSTYTVEKVASGTVRINGTEVLVSCAKMPDNSHNLLINNCSYNIEWLIRDDQKPVIRINGIVMNPYVKDETELLLERLGMNTKAKRVVNELKAPMPGLVRNVRVKVGDDVEEGQPLLVLEAMKMENILKSPVSGRVKAITAENGMAIDKNTVLIQFE